MRTCPPPPARAPSLPGRAPALASRSASVYFLRGPQLLRRIGAPLLSAGVSARPRSASRAVAASTRVSRSVEGPHGVLADARNSAETEADRVTSGRDDHHRGVPQALGRPAARPVSLAPRRRNPGHAGRQPCGAGARTQAEITVAEVDQLIKSLGGQRMNVTSLDHPFRRANRRVRGKTNPPPEALYVLPDEALLQGAAVSRCASVDRPFRASREAEPVCLLHGRATL
jgi:hypothetical protein